MQDQGDGSEHESTPEEVKSKEVDDILRSAARRRDQAMSFIIDSEDGASTHRGPTQGGVTRTATPGQEPNLPTDLESFLFECFDEKALRHVLGRMGLLISGNSAVMIDRILRGVYGWWPVDYWYHDFIYDLSDEVDEGKLYAYCSRRGILVKHREIDEMVSDLSRQFPKLRDVRIPISLPYFLNACFVVRELKKMLTYLEYSDAPLAGISKGDLIYTITVGICRCTDEKKLRKLLDYMQDMTKKRTLKEICEGANLGSDGSKEEVFLRVVDQIPELSATGKAKRRDQHD